MWPFKKKPEPRCEFCGGRILKGYRGSRAIVFDMCENPHDITKTHPWLFKLNETDKTGT